MANDTDRTPTETMPEGAKGNGESDVVRGTETVDDTDDLNLDGGVTRDPGIAEEKNAERAA